MVKVTDVVEKICGIIKDFINSMYIGGISRFSAIHVAMTVLCKVKGQFNVSENVLKELQAYGFDVRSIDELAGIIDCEGKQDEVLPACAEFILEEYVPSLRGGFTQPKELTKLVLHLVNAKGCKNIYNPYAGLASYAIGDFVKSYHGQDFDTEIYELAKRRLFINSVDYSNYILENPVDNWDESGADCVVSTPPFGLYFSPEKRNLFHVSTPEEFLISKFISGNANHAIFVVPRGLCFKSQGAAYMLRKSICESNQLDMVIDLPSGIFVTTGLSTSIIVLNKCRKEQDPVCFVDAEKLFWLKGKKERILKYEEIFQAISSSDSNITYFVNYKELIENEYSFNVVRYAPEVLSVSEGQKIVTLNEILSLDKGVKYEFHNDIVKNVLDSSNFVLNAASFNDVQNEVTVNQPKHKFEGPHIAVNLQGKVYVHKGDSSFYVGTALSRSVFKVNEGSIDIEYLAYKLLESGLLEKAIYRTVIPYVNTKQLLSYKIVVDIEKEKQRKIVAKIKRSFLEGERKRLGIREAGGDLTHMLGMPKDTIGNLIDMLLLSETISDSDREGIKAINDNFRYMIRLINVVGADFSSIADSPRNIKIAEFTRDHAASLKHLKFANCFDIVEDFSLSNSVLVNCDEDLLRVILDTAFRNAYSHGFEQRYSESNLVKFGCRLVEYEGKIFVCITIANNGNPMPSDFSKEDFIVRGKKAGKMGNTGKGGYHIYTIAKKYNGYINVSSSKEWSFILEVLIPAHNVDNNEIIEVYGSECL